MIHLLIIICQRRAVDSAADENNSAGSHFNARQEKTSMIFQLIVKNVRQKIMKKFIPAKQQDESAARIRIRDGWTNSDE